MEDVLVIVVVFPPSATCFKWLYYFPAVVGVLGGEGRGVIRGVLSFLRHFPSFFPLFLVFFCSCFLYVLLVRWRYFATYPLFIVIAPSSGMDIRDVVQKTKSQFATFFIFIVVVFLFPFIFFIFLLFVIVFFVYLPFLGSGPERVDDLRFHTCGEFSSSPPPSSPPSSPSPPPQIPVSRPKFQSRGPNPSL